MADSFELFHLSLRRRDQLILDLGFEAERANVTREEWLRTVFSENQPFNSYGSEFEYVPAKPADDGSLVGRLGRHVAREENKPPSEGLQEYVHDTWIAALLVLDPTHHDDGQKIAVQSVNAVGNPRVLLGNLLSAINARYRTGPYSIEASQIIEAQSFWEWVGKHEGRVTTVTLDVIAPNMFGSQDEFSKEMEALRDNEKIERLKVTLNNPDGLEPDTPRLRDAVDYASRGGGNVKARAKPKGKVKRGTKGPSYDSSKAVKRTSLGDVKATGAELLEAARGLIQRILGRE